MSAQILATQVRKSAGLALATGKSLSGTYEVDTSRQDALQLAGGSTFAKI